MSSRLILTYNSKFSHDGLGAQVHRIVAIYSLSRILNTGYLHTGIKHTTWHPLDNFANTDEFQEYIININKLFNIVSETTTIYHEKIDSNQITFFTLFTIALRSFVSRRTFLVAICEPFRVLDFINHGYRLKPPFPLFQNLVMNTREEYKDTTIAIHYRHGSGDFSTYHKQNQPRQLPLSLFADKVKKLVEVNNLETYSIVFVTDAPEKDIFFKIPQDQIHLWEGTPGYRSGNLYIKGLSKPDVEKAFDYQHHIKFIRGGNPITALATLTGTDYLIMSQSSLSYVAAIYSHGTVLFPKGFWHPKMQEWGY